ncbi:alanine racemase [Candidatus Heimdallarchaeota archaeon]|nr:MAG: alanine racemase [Candidatus Heimdallarchaeota archaeon]
MDISTPTIIIDKDIVLKNIQKMVEKTKKNNIVFRPHFKTHQSIEVGKWFKEFGINRITVSSVSMAKCFASDGWNDITIAFPVNILEIDDINKLSKKIKLNLLVDNLETTEFLEQNIEKSTDIWIKVDVGYHRAGISWNSFNDILKIAKKIESSSKLNFIGVLIHSGNSYKSSSKSEILQVHSEALERISSLKKKFSENGFDSVKVSVGDTPTASVADDFEGIDELRPGNFVFYDLKQLQINSCSEEEIAIRVACPVVSKNKERMELLIYGGGIHFSKDVTVNENGEHIFGYLTDEVDGKWKPIDKEFYVASLSQEHGIIKTDKKHFEKIIVGDVILIVPVHSCMTVNTMRKFRLKTGEEFTANCS